MEPSENSSKKIVHATDIHSLTKENNKLNTELNIFREIVKKRESVSEKDVNDSILALKDDNIQRITKERDSYKQEYQKFRAELIRFASVSKDLAVVENKMKQNPDLNAYILQASALKQANEVLQRELQDLLAKETDLQTANEKLWNDLAKVKRAQVCVCAIEPPEYYTTYSLRFVKFCHFPF
jgi:RNA polymerase-interacting CarD/CdnL/TRCF family regulator